MKKNILTVAVVLAMSTAGSISCANEVDEFSEFSDQVEAALYSAEGESRSHMQDEGNCQSRLPGANGVWATENGMYDDIYCMYAYTEDDCAKYATAAVKTFLEKEPKFANGILKNKTHPKYEVQYADRDFSGDTKNGFGCIIGIQTHLKNASDPYATLKYSVYYTPVDGTVISINEFSYTVLDGI
jgi:hypothetical protein